MGYPSTGAEKMYRNPLDEVLRFFETRHYKKYKIYNLCAEKQYSVENFQSGSVEIFPFFDHNPPPFELMFSFCKSVDSWLSKDNENVIAVHCKAGKGRTGTFICCYLVHCGFCSDADEALRLFGELRTLDGEGVTIKSQRRYVHYYSQCIKTPRNQFFVFPITNIILNLKKIVLYTTPHFDRDGGCDPFFKIETQKYNEKLNETTNCKLFNSKIQYEKPKHFVNQTIIVMNDINLEIEGDVKITFYDEDKLSKSDKMFHFWFNTNFVDLISGKLRLLKSELDGADKDKKHKKFDADFAIEIYFTLNRPGQRSPFIKEVKTYPSLAGQLLLNDFTNNLNDLNNLNDFTNDMAIVSTITNNLNNNNDNNNNSNNITSNNSTLMNEEEEDNYHFNNHFNQSINGNNICSKCGGNFNNTTINNNTDKELNKELIKELNNKKEEEEDNLKILLNEKEEELKKMKIKLENYKKQMERMEEELSLQKQENLQLKNEMKILASLQ
ncbi:hypothetical protein ABK040_004998 [Willaertia magna]